MCVIFMAQCYPNYKVTNYPNILIVKKCIHSNKSFVSAINDNSENIMIFISNQHDNAIERKQENFIFIIIFI